MRPNLITRLKEEWNNLDPVDPLRGLIADAIDALVEAQPSKPLTDEQMVVLNFMLGADDLDGVWFGERHPKEKGAFWWRNRLRNAFQDAAIEAKLREKNA